MTKGVGVYERHVFDVDPSEGACIIGWSMSGVNLLLRQLEPASATLLLGYLRQAWGKILKAAAVGMPYLP